MIDNIHELYYGMQSNKTLVMTWLPNYKEIPEDDIISVEEEMTTPEIGRVLATSHIWTDLWSHSIKKMQKIWDNYWRTFKSSNLHKKIRNFYSLKTSKDFSKQEQVILSRIRTGHCNFSHKHLLTRDPPPICVPCNTSLNIHHLLYYCNLFQDNRREQNIDVHEEELILQ